jgi:hypothetical protein
VTQAFPIGGPRQPVYDALKNVGFVMASFGDKHWDRADGIHAHVYGTGSMLRLTRGQETLIEAPIAEALAFLKQA